MNAAPADAANPVEGLYAFVKNHLVVVNQLVLASMSIVGTLDFFGPGLGHWPKVVYCVTGLVVGFMALSAARPELARKLLGAVGLAARSQDAGPLWRRPRWIAAFLLLSAVTVAGFASVALAGQGGIIASASPGARAAQVSLLSLEADVGAIKAGVREANAKLDAMAADSKDPHKELFARGFAYDEGGLAKAIGLNDRRAVALFVKAGFEARHETPMNVLLSGGRAWDPEIPALLQRSMFPGKACGRGPFAFPVKEPVAERVAAFAKLCDAGPAIKHLEALVADDARAPPPLNDWQIQERAARKRHLALLRG